MAGKFDYFDSFIEQTEVCLEEANLLLETVEGFTTAEAVEETIKKAHEIEHRGDLINHSIYNTIATDFITPIERDDLLAIAQCTDEVTDNIEEVILAFYMYDVRIMPEDAKAFARIIKKGCEALVEAMKEFKNYKKKVNLRPYLIAVNDAEEEGDRLFLEAMRRLYTEDADNPMRVLVWSRLYNTMEKRCDSCEHVADVVATAMLKNS